MDLSNLLEPFSLLQNESSSFVNSSIDCHHTIEDESWRRYVLLVNKLRNSKNVHLYKMDSIDSATQATSIFISKLPDSILELESMIDFDIQMDDSIELVFHGQQQARVNLMLDAINTREEAFLFYNRDGIQTQTNGYMADIVEILKRIL